MSMNEVAAPLPAAGMARRSYPLAAADIDAFRRDGIVCLRGVFDAAAVEGLRAAVAYSMAHPGPWAMNFVGDRTKRPSSATSSAGHAIRPIARFASTVTRARSPGA